MSKHLVCAQWGSAFIVPSSANEYGSGTGGYDTYMVKFHIANKAVCTCPAYRYSGHYDQQTCKHIRQVKQYGCFYVPIIKGAKYITNESIGRNDLAAGDITLFSTTEKNITDTPCPGCGQPMIEVKLP